VQAHRTLVLSLHPTLHEALVDLAVQEQRPTKTQATMLLVEALERAGVLPARQAATDRPPANRAPVTASP
jgi:hypothetical protein